MNTLTNWLDRKEALEGVTLFQVLDFTYLSHMRADAEALLRYNHGHKQVFNPEMSIQVLGKMLAAQYAPIWHNYRQAQKMLDDEDFGSRRTRTTTETRDIKVDYESDKTNKTSAFDSEEMVSVDGSDSIETENRDDQRATTLQDDLTNTRFLFEKLTAKSKQSILQKVVEDVGQFLTLSVY